MDVETTGLLEDDNLEYHCIMMKEFKKDKWLLFCDINGLTESERKKINKNLVDVTWYDISELNVVLASGEIEAIVCHNILGYDLPVLNKLSGTTYTVGPDTVNGVDIRIIDSLIMSRRLYPDRLNPRGCPSSVHNPVTDRLDVVRPHGLMSWGYRVGNMKPVIHDWRNQSLFTYIKRCYEDIKINELTYIALCKEAKDVAIPNGKKKGDWSLPLRMAHKVAYGMYQQAFDGVVLDQKLANWLIEDIDKEMNKIAEEVEPLLPMKALSSSDQPKFPARPYLKRTKKEIDGDKLQRLSDSSIKYGKKFGITKEHEIRQVIENGIPLILEAPMLLKNQQDIKIYLIGLGWEPFILNFKDITTKEKRKVDEDQMHINALEYIEKVKKSPFRKMIFKNLGYKGTPDVSSSAFLSKVKKNGRRLPSSPKFKDNYGMCPNLERLEGEMVKKIIKWLSMKNRRSVLKSLEKDTGWLNDRRLARDGRLSCRSSGITPTVRKKHAGVVNVPKNDPDVLYGKEFRSLFICPDDYLNIGTDACGIEARNAGHAAFAFDGGDYAKELLQGDIHTVNAQTYTDIIQEWQRGVNDTPLRVISRNDGKSPSYAIQYGCGADRISAMLGVPTDIGGRLRDGWWEAKPGLNAYKKALERYWIKTKKKYIMGIDGSKIFIRSQHSLVNFALQSMGALIMDWASCYLMVTAKKEGLDYQRWSEFHDEQQCYQHKDEIEIITSPSTPEKDLPKDKKGKRSRKKDPLKPEQHRDGKQYSDPLYKDGKWIQYYSRVGELLSEGFKKAGEFYNLRIEYAGEYKVGKTWADCH